MHYTFGPGIQPLHTQTNVTHQVTASLSTWRNKFYEDTSSVQLCIYMYRGIEAAYIMSRRVEKYDRVEQSIHSHVLLVCALSRLGDYVPRMMCTRELGRL